MIDGWKDAGRQKLRPFFSDDLPLALTMHRIEPVSSRTWPYCCALIMKLKSDLKPAESWAKLWQSMQL
jgi:hypothetical protein